MADHSPVPCNRHGCKTILPTKAALKTHDRKRHQGNVNLVFRNGDTLPVSRLDDRFQCPKCEVSYPNPATLRVHINRIHVDTPLAPATAPNPRPVWSDFGYHLIPEYGVLVCSECEHGVTADQIRIHHKRHTALGTPNPISSKVHARMIENTPVIIRKVSDLENIAPGPTSIPFPHLPPTPGFGCQVGGCSFVAPHQYTVGNHMRQWHPNSCPPYSPHRCVIQTFHPHTHVPWFSVAYASQNPSEKPAGFVPGWIDAHIAGELDAFEKAEERYEREQLQSCNDVAGDDQSPWLRITDFPTHLQGVDRPSMVALFKVHDHRTIASQEPVASFIDNVCVSTFNKVQEWIPLAPAKVRSWLESESSTMPASKPFAVVQLSTTWTHYVKRWRCLFAYLHRLPDSSCGILKKRVNHCLRTCPDLAEAVKAWRLFTKSRKDLKIVDSKSRRELLNVVIALIKQTVEDDYDGLLVHFFAVLSVHSTQFGYLGPDRYTQTLAAFQHTIKAASLYYVYHNPPARSSKPEDIAHLRRIHRLEFMAFRESHLVQGSASSMDVLLGWLRYGMKINMTTIQPGQFIWQDNRSMLTFKGRSFEISKFKLLVRTMQDELERHIIDKLCFGWNPIRTYVGLVDDRERLDPGFAIWKNKLNISIVGTPASPKTLLQLASRVEYRQHYRHTDCSIKPSGLRNWLSQFGQLQLLLVTLCYAAGGMPPRGNEHTKIRMKRGSNSPRNVFLVGDDMVLETRYHKGQSKSGREKVIPRFLPARLRDALLAYFWYLRPFARFAQEHLGHKNKSYSSEFLWPNESDGNPIDAGKITTKLRTLSSTFMGIPLGIADWRQVVIKIDRDVIRSPAQDMYRAGLGDLGDGEETADDVHDLQAAHSTRVAHMHYGLDRQSLGQVSEDMYTKFSQVSRMWHKFIGLADPDDRGLAAPPSLKDGPNYVGKRQRAMADSAGNHHMHKKPRTPAPRTLAPRQVVGEISNPEDADMSDSDDISSSISSNSTQHSILSDDPAYAETPAWVTGGIIEDSDSAAGPASPAPSHGALILSSPDMFPVDDDFEADIMAMDIPALTAHTSAPPPQSSMASESPAASSPPPTMGAWVTIGEYETPDNQVGMRRALRTITGSPTADWRTHEQRMIIERLVLAKHPVDYLAILPTGFGKSLSFFIPAMLFDDKITVVIAPYVSLIDDLQARAEELHLKPVRWKNSKPDPAVASLLFASADALDKQPLRQWLGMQEASKRLGRIIFDEAHVIVTAKSYRPCLQAAILLRRLSVPIIWQSATIPPRVECELRQLTTYDQNPALLQTIRLRVQRHNIKYTILRYTDQAELELDLVGNHGQIDLKTGVPRRGPRTIGLIRSLTQRLEKTNTRGIIYAQTHDALEVFGRVFGIPTYSSEVANRQSAFQEWRAGSSGCRWIAGTSGIGAGLDIGDVSIVLSVDPPTDILEWVQQSGRAGRSIPSAEAFILEATRPDRGRYYLLQRLREQAREDPAANAGFIAIRRMMEEWGCVRPHIHEALHGPPFDAERTCSTYPGALVCSNCESTITSSPSQVATPSSAPTSSSYTRQTLSQHQPVQSTPAATASYRSQTPALPTGAQSLQSLETADNMEWEFIESLFRFWADGCTFCHILGGNPSSHTTGCCSFHEKAGVTTAIQGTYRGKNKLDMRQGTGCWKCGCPERLCGTLEARKERGGHCVYPNLGYHIGFALFKPPGSRANLAPQVPQLPPGSNEDSGFDLFWHKTMGRTRRHAGGSASLITIVASQRGTAMGLRAKFLAGILYL